MDLDSLRQRRLDNLDAAILYFGKRLTAAKKRSAKASSLSDIDLCALEIRLLEDMISYLKLC